MCLLHCASCLFRFAFCPSGFAIRLSRFVDSGCCSSPEPNSLVAWTALLASLSMSLPLLQLHLLLLRSLPPTLSTALVKPIPKLPTALVKPTPKLPTTLRCKAATMDRPRNLFGWKLWEGKLALTFGNEKNNIPIHSHSPHVPIELSSYCDMQ